MVKYKTVSVGRKSGVQPRPRPCRRCLYEGHYCYNPRSPGRLCDTCIKYNNCYHDLTGVVGWRYKKARKRAMQGSTPALRSLAVNKMRRLVRAPPLVGDCPLVEDRTSVRGHLPKANEMMHSEHDINTFSSTSNVTDSTGPLVIHHDWMPKKRDARRRISRSRPCRPCFVEGRKCYQTEDNDKCNRCATTRNKRCHTSLERAVSCGYMRHKHEQQTRMQDYGMEVFTKSNESADYLSLASSSNEEPPKDAESQREWSSSSEDEQYDSEDIGLKVLTLYQANPPRTQHVQIGDRIPCRRCLQERLCCQRRMDQTVHVSCAREGSRQVTTWHAARIFW